MNTGKLLRFLSLPFALSLVVSCASVEPAPSRTVGGQSLDQPPSPRYTPGVTNSGTQTLADSATIEDDLPVTTDSTTTTETPSETTVNPPVDSTTGSATPPAPQPAPAYGNPVPGRVGFVYPPGVEHKPENMVDVRDFTPGQKVRDPRTGKIFLVP